jgi:hypothetical protein
VEELGKALLVGLVGSEARAAGRSALVKSGNPGLCCWLGDGDLFGVGNRSKGSVGLQQRDDGTLSPWTLGGGGFRIAGPKIDGLYWSVLARQASTGSINYSSSRAEEDAVVK